MRETPSTLELFVKYFVLLSLCVPCAGQGNPSLVTRFTMPHQPLRNLRPELFNEERTIDAFIHDDDDEGELLKALIFLQSKISFAVYHVVFISFKEPNIFILPGSRK